MFFFPNVGYLEIFSGLVDPHKETCFQVVQSASDLFSSCFRIKRFSPKKRKTFLKRKSQSNVEILKKFDLWALRESVEFQKTSTISSK
ncbi:hypothetical protein CEXT_45761 [Caerostris extrusa]|uniref:Uncharacterized protein n=1 Tax=Caerostris extrusa TaxID=172846 RepID=A0AAV4XQS2_CAEEX|nr:hypothetical protein CEXT_45761 [Caerostris extrusa]